MGVSKNNGTPKSSILIGFSLINHPFWGTTIFGNAIIGLYTSQVVFLAGFLISTVPSLASLVQVAVTPKGEGAEEPSGKSVTFTLVRQGRKLWSNALFG